MPSPKAILRDVADLGLDPNAHHSACAKNGRIKVHVVTDVVVADVQPVVDPVPVTVDQQSDETAVAKVELQVDQLVKSDHEKKPVKNVKKKVDDGQVS